MTDTRSNPKPAAVSRVPLSVAVFALALLVRLLYLWESADNPTFFTPIVDAWTYHERALALLAGEVEPSLFWQPVFYPLFLAGVYQVFGPSFVAVKLVQAVVGALTCALAACTAGRVMDRRAGWVAGVIAALYGPLIFFDGELLAAGWAAMWMSLLVYLLVRLRERPTAMRGAILGLVAALAVLTRPTFAAPLLLVAVCLAFVLSRRAASRSRAMGVMAAAVIGFALIALPAGLWTKHVTGRMTLMPSSGGINLYIGNNPDSDATVRIRPGYQWTLLDQLPAKHGVRGMWDSSAWFHAQVRDYATTEPGDWMRGMVSKSMQLICSRELARNVDVYVFRDWSAVLTATTWRLGGFGFPFGVLLPLTVVGLVAHRRHVPLALPLMVVGYAGAIVLVFVSARYRLPLVPVLCVLAAGGVVWLWDACRARRWRGVAAAGAGCIVIALLGSAFGPFPQERNDYRAELELFLARAAYRDGDDAATLAHLTAAARRIPGDSGVHNALATLFLKTGDVRAAGEHAARAVQLDARNYEAHATLGDARMRAGDAAGAAAAYIDAIAVGPPDPTLHHKLSGALARRGRFDQALTQLETALTLDERNAMTLRMLAHLLATAPDATLRDPRRALTLAQRARERLGEDDAVLLSAVAAAHAELGRFDDAIAIITRAIALAPADSPLAQQLARERERYRRGLTYPSQQR